MPTRDTDRRDHELDDEIARYREAATKTLEQLEWTVGYLRQVHKPKIAQALERNRREIARRMH